MKEESQRMALEAVNEEFKGQLKELRRDISYFHQVAQASIRQRLIQSDQVQAQDLNRLKEYPGYLVACTCELYHTHGLIL